MSKAVHPFFAGINTSAPALMRYFATDFFLKYHQSKLQLRMFRYSMQARLFVFILAYCGMLDHRKITSCASSLGSKDNPPWRLSHAPRKYKREGMPAYHLDMIPL